MPKTACLRHFLNFVNKMDVGEKYLVFLDKEVVKGSEIYVPSEDFFFSPFFSYKSKNNVPAGIDEEYSYKGYGHAVQYKKLKNNEFFGDTSECIEKFNNIKSYLIKKYPE